MAIENSVSNNFLFYFVASINVFDCRLPGVVKLLTEHHLEFLSLKGACTAWSESTLFKMPHCWNSHVTGTYYALEAHPHKKQSLHFLLIFIFVNILQRITNKMLCKLVESFTLSSPVSSTDNFYTQFGTRSGSTKCQA